MDAKSIGNTLRQLREKKGKTMQEVADDLDLTVSAISRYESGERIPQDDIKKRLAAYYKRSVGGIFFTD
jgi:transcriptional regulator with XRE-family HTH domain